MAKKDKFKLDANGNPVKVKRGRPAKKVQAEVSPSGTPHTQPVPDLIGGFTADSFTVDEAPLLVPDAPKTIDFAECFQTSLETWVDMSALEQINEKPVVLKEIGRPKKRTVRPTMTKLALI